MFSATTPAVPSSGSSYSSPGQANIDAGPRARLVICHVGLPDADVSTLDVRVSECVCVYIYTYVYTDIHMYMHILPLCVPKLVLHTRVRAYIHESHMLWPLSAGCSLADVGPKSHGSDIRSLPKIQSRTHMRSKLQAKCPVALDTEPLLQNTLRV